MLDLVFIAIAALAVWRATRRGLSAGFPLAAALFVLLPGQLRIELPGALPELTVHRILLAILIQGPALGAALVATGGTSITFGLNALSFFYFRSFCFSVAQIKY